MMADRDIEAAADTAAAIDLTQAIQAEIKANDEIIELTGLMVGVTGREACARLVHAWHQTKLRDAERAVREHIANEIEGKARAGDAADVSGMSRAARIARGQQ